MMDLILIDANFGEGDKIGEGEFLQSEDGETVIHTYFEVEEADQYFTDMKLLLKEHRIIERMYEGEMIKQGYIDYIVQKKK